MLLQIDIYLIKNVFSFVSNGEIFILYETCKYFKNIINYFEIKKESPFIYDVLKNFKMIHWAESHSSFYYPDDALQFAIKRNNINIVKYVYEKNPNSNDSFCYIEAIQNNNFNIIKWLRKQNFELSECVFSAASQYADFKIIKWLKKKECPFDSYSVNCAAYKGRLRILKFLINNGCDWENVAFNYACKSGNLDCVKFLHKEARNDLSKPWWDMSVTTTAAEFGHLHILKFLRYKLCPWGINATYNAAKNKHVESLQWLLENYCPVDEIVYNYLPELGLYYEKERLNIVV